MNPDANQVNVYDSGAFSDYHALQLEIRRRLSRGLQVNGSYQYALEGGSSFLGFHFGRVMIPTNGSVRHAIKTQWDWKLPVGRGERFGANAHPILNGIIGGWQFNGVGRIPGAHVELRQRPPRRHDERGRAEAVQVGRSRRSRIRPANACTRCRTR